MLPKLRPCNMFFYFEFRCKDECLCVLTSIPFRSRHSQKGYCDCLWLYSQCVHVCTRTFVGVCKVCVPVCMGHCVQLLLARAPVCGSNEDQWEERRRPAEIQVLSPCFRPKALSIPLCSTLPASDKGLRYTHARTRIECTRSHKDSLMCTTKETHQVAGLSP